MNAIDRMMEEHRLIEKVIEALKSFAGREGTWGEEDRAVLGRFVRFFREYADACHHSKEEDILFDAMVEAGFPREAGPIGVMLHEHELGRRFVRSLAESAESEGPWTDDERTAVRSAARGYSGLLREHIQKEDHILYPMAQSHLSSEAMDRVNGECDRKEEAMRAGGSKEALEALAGKLIERYPRLG